MSDERGSVDYRVGGDVVLSGLREDRKRGSETGRRRYL